MPAFLSLPVPVLSPSLNKLLAVRCETMKDCRNNAHQLLFTIHCLMRISVCTHLEVDHAADFRKSRHHFRHFAMQYSKLVKVAMEGAVDCMLFRFLYCKVMYLLTCCTRRIHFPFRLRISEWLERTLAFICILSRLQHDPARATP